VNENVGFVDLDIMKAYQMIIIGKVLKMKKR